MVKVGATLTSKSNNRVLSVNGGGDTTPARWNDCSRMTHSDKSESITSDSGYECTLKQRFALWRHNERSCYNLPPQACRLFSFLPRHLFPVEQAQTFLARIAVIHG